LTETERIKEIIINPAVDDVDATQSRGGPHIDNIVVHQEIAAFHELDAHLLGKECVLEIGGIEYARSQENDFRFVPCRRTNGRQGAQRRQQGLRVMIHRTDAVVAEQGGKHLLQHLAIGQHVRHSAGDTKVIL
jgi:hypothetical protein